MKAPKRAPKYGTKAGMSQKPLKKLSFSEKKTPSNVLYFIATYNRGPKSRAGFIADLKINEFSSAYMTNSVMI